MNVHRLFEILKETTCQFRKGDVFEGTPELVEQAKRGADLSGGGVLEVYAMPHESEAPPDIEKIDVWFVTIGVNRAAAEARKGEVLAILAEYPHPDRLAQGLTYIEVGGVLGDQGAAFQLFALGKVLGIWDVITPTTLGITDPAQGRDLAGRGFIMMTGHKIAA